MTVHLGSVEKQWERLAAVSILEGDARLLVAKIETEREESSHRYAVPAHAATGKKNP